MHDSVMKKTWFESLLRPLSALAVMGCAALLAAAAPTVAAAPFENTIAQRTLACTACHGPQGQGHCI